MAAYIWRRRRFHLPRFSSNLERTRYMKIEDEGTETERDSKRKTMVKTDTRGIVQLATDTPSLDSVSSHRKVSLPWLRQKMRRLSEFGEALPQDVKSISRWSAFPCSTPGQRAVKQQCRVSTRFATSDREYHGVLVVREYHRLKSSVMEPGRTQMQSTLCKEL